MEAKNSSAIRDPYYLGPPNQEIRLGGTLGSGCEGGWRHEPALPNRQDVATYKQAIRHQ